MNPRTLGGICLVLLGCAVLAVGRFSYTTEKPVVELGPLTASVTEQHSVQLPTLAGFGLILAGGLLAATVRRKA